MPKDEQKIILPFWCIYNRWPVGAQRPPQKIHKNSLHLHTLSDCLEILINYKVHDADYIHVWMAEIGATAPPMGVCKDYYAIFRNDFSQSFSYLTENSFVASWSEKSIGFLLYLLRFGSKRLLKNPFIVYVESPLNFPIFKWTELRGLSTKWAQTQHTTSGHIDPQ